MKYNALHQLLEIVKTEADFIDLVDTNFTHNGFYFPVQILIEAANKYFLTRSYEPDSKGLFTARRSISRYYENKGAEIPPANIIITASTSESYNLVFNNLCKPGDSILLPNPGYPLFEQLAEYNHLTSLYYPLDPKDNWQPDIGTMEKLITPKTKLIVLISPNNPTGSIIDKSHLQKIIAVSKRHNLLIVADEVFSEFVYKKEAFVRLAGLNKQVSVITLNGISKMFTLPDLKLAWIAVSGLPQHTQPLIEKLELANDTYLNASYLTQAMLPSFFNSSNAYLAKVRHKLSINLTSLTDLLVRYKKLINYVEPVGGIHAVLQIQIPDLDEEQFVLDLLKETHILVHPGYFYDFPGQKKQVNIIISFLKEKQQFETGLARLLNFSQKQYVKYR